MMAPTDEEQFVAAETWWASGRVKAAAAAHLDLTRKAQSTELRLRSALVLIERLNPAWDAELILEACSTGLAMATKLGENATQAYLMGMRAKNLAIFAASLVEERKSLRLAPGWIGFSLGRDESTHKALSEQIDKTEHEIDQLAQNAQKQSPDQTTLGHVLMSVAHISFQRYMGLKSDRLRMSVRLPSLIREWLRTSGLDEYFWYASADRQAMRNHLEQCEKRYNEAISAFRSADDELNVAYAYYAVANDLRSANRFRQATRYLDQAEAIARRHNDEQLANRIPVLRERIRKRNKNIPNYVAGEGRPET
jgi:tetratricopeptide (TPR) repeat protein